MMKQWLLGLVFATALTSVAEEIKVPAVDKPPKLDGKLNDDAWRKATKRDDFHVYKTEERPDETTAHICRDDAWLYLAFECDNPGMRHLEQTAFEHATNVYDDDSVEIFIDPGTQGRKTRQIFLNFGNVICLKTFGPDGQNSQVVGGGKMRDALRCATIRRRDGWTAEIAIPFFALEGGDLSKTKINLMRNRIIPEIDEMGAKFGERKQYQVLGDDAIKDASKYLNVVGFENLTPETPFAPEIRSVNVGSFQLKNGKYVYPVTLDLATVTPIGGTTQICVKETREGQEREHETKTLDLKGSEKVTVEVPVKNFSPRGITVILRDAKGSPLARKMLPANDSLSIIRDAFVGRNYYTSEKNAKIKIIFGMAKQLREQIELTLSLGDKVVYRKKNPEEELVATIPLSELSLGDNTVELAVGDQSQTLFQKQLAVKKVKPYPNHEVKADLIRGVMLKNDEPFFPIGIWANEVKSVDERIYKFLGSKIGFNTLMQQFAYREIPRKCTLDDLPGAMEYSAKHNMDVIFWGRVRFETIEGISTDLPFDQQVRIARERYEKILPIIKESSRIFMKYPNAFMHFNVDEPNLHNPELCLKVLKWYAQSVEKIDPYHPQFINFSKRVPKGDKWTRWGVAISDDIYPRPGDSVLLGKPGLSNSYYAYKIRRRCEKDHKIMFMVPLAGQLSVTKCPVSMTNQQMLCQNYTSLIYGAKGILFFEQTTPSNHTSWDGIKTIVEHIKALSPALLNHPVQQNVTYPGQEYNPMGIIFPQVVAAVFKFPDGDHLLLAANIRYSQARSSFKFSGAREAVRLFGDQQNMKVGNDTFEDVIEPYGVRAYRIKAPSQKTIELAVVSEPNNDVQNPPVDIPKIVQQMRMGKNHCPNPCFKRQKVPGTPDFYRPHLYDAKYFTFDLAKKGSSWFVDEKTTWNGNPSLCMDVTKKYHAMGTLAACYPPISDKPMDMTLSLYAKAAKKGDGLKCKIPSLDPNASRTIRLTTE